MMLAIFVSSAALALETPRNDSKLIRTQLLVLLDTLCVWIFTAEFALKMVAYGLVFTPTAYLKSYWHQVLNSE